MAADFRGREYGGYHSLLVVGVYGSGGFGVVRAWCGAVLAGFEVVQVSDLVVFVVFVRMVVWSLVFLFDIFRGMVRVS